MKRLLSFGENLLLTNIDLVQREQNDRISLSLLWVEPAIDTVPGVKEIRMGRILLSLL